MNTACAPFSEKKITQMGLGVLGRGVQDAAFFADCGAQLTVTDLKTERALQQSIEKLAPHDSITYVLGEHRLEDFEDRDLILKGAGVPIDSPYIAHARERGIQIAMDESLFAQHAPEGVTIIGVTGTRGKTTTASLIAHILTDYVAGTDASVHLSGNVPGAATLPLLHTVRSGDYVVLELSSWQLQGFREASISPSVAVFTNFMPDHLNYYNNDLDTYFYDKQSIYANQRADDVCIAGESVASRIKEDDALVSHLHVARAGDVPADWESRIRGEHNRENIACALQAVRALGVPDAVSQAAVATFSPVSGRLSLAQTVHGVQVYNDNNATTPHATKAALESFSDKSVVLIMGGTDKGIDFSSLYPEIERKCTAVVLYDESGTKSIEGDIRAIPGISVKTCQTLADCIEQAFELVQEGSVVLYSPAFASFGRDFANEYDREEQFLDALKEYASR